MGPYAARLSRQDQQALWRAATPYYDHGLDPDGRLSRWNENPLIYVLDADNPLKDLSAAEIRQISLANTYLYIAAFAMNTPGPGGLQFYTSAADWALYFQPVQDSEFLAFRSRRLYGTILRGGYEWAKIAFTLPIECNRFKLTGSHIDTSLVDAATALYESQTGKAEGYLFPIQTFMSGTSDLDLWEREGDLSLIWGRWSKYWNLSTSERAARRRKR